MNNEDYMPDYEKPTPLEFVKILLITIPILLILFYYLPKKLYRSKYFDYVRQHNYLRIPVCTLYIIGMIFILDAYTGGLLFMWPHELWESRESHPIFYYIVLFIFEAPSYLDIFRYIF